MPRPMLDGVELEQVQRVEAEDEEVLGQHGVPALEGDFLQDLGRRVTRLTLTGVITGATSGDQLKTLREKFRAATPVPFVDDIAVATKVEKVLIEEFGVRELAGRPNRFEFEMTLREFLPPPRPEQEEPPPPPPPPPVLPDVDTSTLVVEVIVEGQPNFDFSKLQLTVETPQKDGASLSRTLTKRENNVWTEEKLPPGEYTIKAVETNPQPVLGATTATLNAAQTTQATLQAQVGAVIAKQLIVHFRSDRSFVEPCMRAVLRQAATRASDPKAAADEKLLIVGHTDKVDVPAYNQGLSERRARAVFAYLTFGRDSTGAFDEWDLLRQGRPKGESPSVKDNWGIHEYQHMLQDLGFYPGQVDGKDGDLTRDAVSAFRCQKGLPQGTNVDDAVWKALIKDYLSQDALAVGEAKFFPNARDACNSGILKWTGCGEDDPVKNTEKAFRPSRRVELLFAQTAGVPCELPQPDTFDLPPPGGKVNEKWCLGPKTTTGHCCFVVPVVPKKDFKPKPEQWTRTPMEPGTISVSGKVTREDGKPLTSKNRKLVVITPIGEINGGEQSNGEPFPMTLKTDGTFQLTDKPIGVYSVFVEDDVLIRLDTQKATEAKGNAVCKTLTSSDATLNIVILTDPALRQVKLPVVAHLMTALHPTTREIRTCIDTLSPGPPKPQTTARTAQEVRDLFDGANDIWRQARIRFDLIDIVEEVYSDPAHPDCAVDEQQLATLLFNGAYPDTINVYFVGTLESVGEAGVDVVASQVDDAGNVIATTEGVGIGDNVRLKIFVNADPVLIQPNKLDSIQILAHELGHHLNLGRPDHPPSTPANEGRLMLADVSPDHTKLVKDEVTQSRKAPNAALQCHPLLLRVTGATQIGGTRSADFITFQGAAPVVVDALVNGSADITTGTVNMTGGTPGASSSQQTVDTASARNVDIVATYAATGSTVSTTSRARIRVATFDLRVDGATRNAPGSQTFVVKRQPNQLVTITVALSSQPFSVPKSLVTWDKGQEVPDPLRRTVSTADIASTTVTATIGTTSRAVTIMVVEVVVSSNADPFGPAVAQVQIEGILNKDLKDIDVGDLFDKQPDSLFRIRADIPGQSAAVTQMTAAVTSKAPDGTNIETIGVTLKRTPSGGNSFLSLPLLAIPAVLPAADINVKSPANLNVIRGRAGGKLSITVNSPIPLGNLGTADVVVRGRVVAIAAQSFAGSGVSAADMRRQIGLAARAWAQAGIEVTQRSVQAGVADPGGLTNLDHDVPFSGKLTGDEKLLTGVSAGGPTRSAVATDLNVYYVKEINGPAAGVTYNHEDFHEVTDPGQSAIAIEIPSDAAAAASDTELTHEIGHHLLVNWGGDDHQDHAGHDWPDGVIMHPSVTVQKDLDRTQVENILLSTRLGNNPFVVFVP